MKKQAVLEKNKGSEKKTSNYTVVKRNGTLVPFHRERILYAIDASFRDTKKIPKGEPFDADLKEAIERVTDVVVTQVLHLSSKGTCLTVEGIQDVVEVTLMKKGYHDVARDYIIYRDKHKEERQDAPQNLKIFRTDGSLVRFNPMKIAIAIENVFRKAKSIDTQTPDEVLDEVGRLTQSIAERATEMKQLEEKLSVDQIEDMIEELLMSEKIYDVAKLYILERSEKKKKEPALVPPPAIDEKERKFTVFREDGSKQKVAESQLRRKFSYACRGLEKEVNVDDLTEASILNFYEGMKEKEVDISNIMAAKIKIEVDPAYSIAASRLLLDVIYRETLGVSASDPRLKEIHKKYFKKYLKESIQQERVNPELLDFDLDEIASAMKLDRDDLFYYLGLQNLYDRYFIHDQERRVETPQIFWMRVSMGLALREKEKTKRAIEFYDILSQFYYVSGTPTLFNSGTTHSQLSSCYLSTVMDDLSHIFKVISDDAQLSKWAGGLGNDWTNVRATGARIKGTNGKSQGVIPFLKVANDTAVAVNQCFAPDTMIYTGKGIRPISDIKKGDLVLGISGKYREVTECYAYNQKDPMVSIDVKHSIDPITVTSGHPFYAIQGIPMEQSVSRSLKSLEDGKTKCEWIESKDLKSGDYIAKSIPKETVAVAEFEEEDARLYGILLGDGHLSKKGLQWGVSGNPANDSHLEFVRSYLRKRNIHSWETGRGETYVQIHWASGRGVVQDETTGQFVSSGEPTLLFVHEDIYDSKGKKRISPRLSHLPRPQALAMIQGLVETDGNVSKGKEITFCNTSQSLVEGLRYQLLRLGVPSAGNYRVRNQDHTGMRSDGTEITFKGECKQSYELRIPAVTEIANKVNCTPLTKQNWFIHNGHIFTRIKDVNEAEVQPFVYDLAVEGDESYMTTSGLAHNGGKRKGALCTYLETWHLDIEDFLELRKNTGDERRRTPDMNTANWIPDLFMKRIKENGMWTLFSPNDVPDLHDLYGQAFEKRYAEYEKMAEEGKIALFKKVEALNLWRKMLSMLFETGHPWITFKDPSNIRSPQDHMGVVHSSNLCTEILLNTSKEEVAVCNLGSINLAKHTSRNGLDEQQLSKTVQTAIRMLDNVIDINFYPIPEAKNANMRHRPIGLGMMGFQDALYLQNISYASHESVQFSDESMEMISYYAILTSSELAKERGTYESYKGSKWDRGLLPIDTIELLERERGGNVDMDRSSKMDWNKVRSSVRENGMRNSNTMAIAPTATIANITGVTQSIEPMYKHLFVKSNLSGEFTIVNPFLINKLKELKVWDQEMVDDLKYFDGSIQEIERIPQRIKEVYLSAFEIDPEWIIECASRRQKWIDMGQSLNLYLSEPSGKKLHQMYLLCWEKGLKTQYYLRSLGATQIEKSTVDVNKRGLQPRWMKNKSASSNVNVTREAEEHKVCNLEEGCESCQ